MTRTHIAFLTVAISLAAAGGASAQNIGGNGGIAGGGFSPPVRGVGQPTPTNLPAPPALPGAARHETAAPATKPVLDMAPNDALFDAINRGDMTSAKDALSRGADIGAHNVLGMTPLELSVDLARNDITFLLLSMRGASSPGPGGPVVAANAAAARPARAAPHSRDAQAHGATDVSASVRARRPAPEIAGAGLPPASVRYAGSTPGNAVPQAGFLGF